MQNIDLWLTEFQTRLDETFTNRIYFLGLQGSYARGEATASSDLDVVVIFDELTPADLQKKEILFLIFCFFWFIF